MIFKREFRRGQKSLIIWSLVLAGLIIWLLSIFPQFAEGQKSMESLFDAYPESMKQMFRMDQLNLGTLIGFYGIEVYMMTTLLGSIYAALLASNILAKEENEKTIEFLLSKPVSRSQVVAEKLMAVIVNLFILNIVSTLSSIIGFQFAKDEAIPWDTFTLLTIATLLLHVTFAAIAFMFSSIMRKTRNVLSVSLAVVIVSYFINIMSGLSEELDILKYFSPFKFVDAANIINDQMIEPIYLILIGAIILISVSVSFMIYKKKDISV
ncbi:ABC transporter permease subunit [Bacillus sp. DTU_2020_1000418_1_SI_GHA_SEK_038]|uniref:ABC transporter permease subunit n=1 Tax=Bacillus sp. DTU_2020_1000418_1_SI_GHA_SEK_038 TaxID=3077585 RepID=UPI0028E9ACE6|nr:ABC transporter permease subunit [Bacillus sp. DTU_2020_1000418_1_SI_GHA_SEK_038]WNS74903.1 ABC transporter permease subunit [Bacillus sp. DTU_2020_1000418_1_SI_GHA_SEK_038]